MATNQQGLELSHAYLEKITEKQELFLQFANQVVEQEEIDFNTFSLLASDVAQHSSHRPEAHSFNKDEHPEMHEICRNLGKMAYYGARNMVLIRTPRQGTVVGKSPASSYDSDDQSYHRFLPRIDFEFKGWGWASTKTLIVDAKTPLIVARNNGYKYVAEEELVVVGSLITSLEQYSKPIFERSKVVVGDDVLSEARKEDTPKINEFLQLSLDSSTYRRLF